MMRSRREKKKRMYEELCVTDYDDQVCKEFAENEDLHDELYGGDEE